MKKKVLPIADRSCNPENPYTKESWQWKPIFRYKGLVEKTALRRRTGGQVQDCPPHFPLSPEALPHKPNQNNLSRQAPLFQQEADEKVIPHQANQTLWLFHIRQDQTLLLFFVAVPSIIPQCIKYQCCNTEDGKWKYSLTHYPTTTTKQLPSRQVPLLKREDDERVWLMWNN